MGVATFDTLGAFNALVEAGAEKPLAEAIVAAIVQGDEHAVTKTELDIALERLEHRMITKLGKMMFAMGTILCAVLALLIKLL